MFCVFARVLVVHMRYAASVHTLFDIIQTPWSKIKHELLFLFLPDREKKLPKTFSIFPSAFKEKSHRQQIHGRNKASYRVPFSRQVHWQDQI